MAHTCRLMFRRVSQEANDEFEVRLDHVFSPCAPPSQQDKFSGDFKSLFLLFSINLIIIMWAGFSLLPFKKNLQLPGVTVFLYLIFKNSLSRFFLTPSVYCLPYMNANIVFKGRLRLTCIVGVIHLLYKT